jgi:hypothetical protein
MALAIMKWSSEAQTTILERDECPTTREFKLVDSASSAVPQFTAC